MKKGYIYNEPELYAYKNNLRGASNRLGATLLGIFAVMLGWSFVFIRFCTWLGIDAITAIELTDRPEINLLVQVFVSLFMTILPTLVFCRVQHEKVQRIVSFSLPEGPVAAVAVIGVAFCLLSSILTDYMGQALSFLNYEPPTVEFESVDGFFGVLLTFIACAAVPALAEELAMRGIVLGALRKYGDGFAIIASAIVFGFMHASVYQIPFAFLGGLFFGYITVKTGSIWTAVLVHFLNNALSTLFDYISRALPNDLTNTVYVGMVLLLFLAATVNTVYLFKKWPQFFELRDNSSLAEQAGVEISTANKLKCLILSPVMLIGFAASLAIAFLLR